LSGVPQNHMFQGLMFVNQAVDRELSCNSEPNFMLIALALQIVHV